MSAALPKNVSVSVDLPRFLCCCKRIHARQPSGEVKHQQVEKGGVSDFEHGVVVAARRAAGVIQTGIITSFQWIIYRIKEAPPVSQFSGWACLAGGRGQMGPARRLRADREATVTQLTSESLNSAELWQLEADGQHQQQTTPSATSVEYEQETEAAVGAASPQMDKRVLDRLRLAWGGWISASFPGLRWIQALDLLMKPVHRVTASIFRQTASMNLFVLNC